MQADIVWKASISAKDPGFAAARDRAVEMNHLRPGVDAGIRAAGAMHANGRAGNVCQRLLESVLDGDYMGVTL